MTVTRAASRTLAALALGLTLGLAAFQSPASAQAPAKEPTDGFFDVPPREDAGESYGVPYYMVTSALGGAAIFCLCKSARRG